MQTHFFAVYFRRHPFCCVCACVLRSGSHEELQRANGDSDQSSDNGMEEEKKKISRVYRYTYMLPHDNNTTVPMFVIGYQELYNTALTEVTAIRVWKFVRSSNNRSTPLCAMSAQQLFRLLTLSFVNAWQVFDEKHSDSDLWSKLMAENKETCNQGGTAHQQNKTRRSSMVMEQKQSRVVTGGLSGLNKLEYYCGTQYSRVVNESNIFNMIMQYGGKNMYDDGRPVFDYARLPPGFLNKTLVGSKNELGGTHPLSPEYMFNARRKMALCAGLIDCDGLRIDVHPDFLDPEKHFSEHGDFKLPDVCLETKGFFFCTNPNVTNIFDAPLPRSIYGAVCAGKHLLQLFKDENKGLKGIEDGSNATLSDCFNFMMTCQDAELVAMEKQMGETIFAYDSIDVTDVERKGLRHYGDRDENSAYIIEPRQIMKEIQVQTQRVISELVAPWKLKRDKLASAKDKEIRRSDGENSDLVQCDHADSRLRELHELETETRERHCAVVKDLMHLHISRIEAAFESKTDRETIPAGYCAMHAFSF